MSLDLRAQRLHHWLQQHWQQPIAPPVAIFADASFRRYFRYQRNGINEIAMDAPPAQEDCRPFVALTQALMSLSLPVPQLLASNLDEGFLCLSDLGDEHLYQRLIGSHPLPWYRQALAIQRQFCQLQGSELGPLPLYDAPFLQQELQLMPQWYAEQHLAVSVPSELWQPLVLLLVENALVQPQVAVHRDFHSRNLMVVDEQLALLDYQGARQGPLCYDLVSLLRDCYLTLDETHLTALLTEHYHQLIDAQLVPCNVPFSTFQRWFDLIGLQRHIKVLGIFARLFHRDGKAAYLADLPRVREYVINIGLRYPETTPFAHWLQAHPLPTEPSQ
ncbi:MAG: phosphotransferase [Ferrimonas sp.]